jgi:hypothetical protein
VLKNQKYISYYKQMILNKNLNVDFENIYITNVQKNLQSVISNFLDEYLKTSRYNLLVYNSLINDYNLLDNNYIQTDNNNTKVYVYTYINDNNKDLLRQKICSLLLEQKRIFCNFDNIIKKIYKEYSHVNLQAVKEIKEEKSNKNIISRNISELRELFKNKKKNKMENDNSSIKSVKSVKSIKSVKSVVSSNSDSQKKYVVNRSNRSNDTSSLNEEKKKKFTLFKKTSINDSNI